MNHAFITLIAAIAADASGDPLIIVGLPAGPHKVEIILANANHQPLDQAVVEFAVP